MEEENVVITGGSGFIGRAVRASLQGARARVTVVDRVAGDEVHVSDLSDPASLLPPSLRDTPFTLVHLAWATDRPPTFADHAVQVTRLASVVDYWQGRGLRRVVAAGSAEEYGARAGRLREGDDDGPAVSPYGWGKHAAAQLLRTWSMRHGIPVFWLRPFIVYGPGQRGNMVVPYAVRQAAAGEPARFSDGQQIRDFVFVDDVGRAFAAAATLAEPAVGFQAINVGTGEGVRVADVLETMQKMLDPRPVFELGAIPRREGEPPLQVADIDAAARHLGWRPATPLHEGLRRTVAAALPSARLRAP